MQSSHVEAQSAGLHTHTHTHTHTHIHTHHTCSHKYYTHSHTAHMFTHIYTIPITWHQWVGPFVPS